MFEGLLSPTHLLLVLVVALLVFGPKKLPEMSRSLGQGIRGFKHSLSGEDEPQTSTNVQPYAPQATPAPPPLPPVAPPPPAVQPQAAEPAAPAEAPAPPRISR